MAARADTTKWIDPERAYAFVAQHGSEAERALAGFATDRISAGDALDVLRRQQRPDGGWTSFGAGDRAPISTISHTWVALHWLERLGIYTGEALESTLAFVRASQSSEGSWDEPEALRRFDPPPWMAPGHEPNRIWLTSAITRSVQQLERCAAIDFAAALAYLRRSFGPDGYPAYLHTHWMALQIFSELAPQSALDLQIARSCTQKLLDALSRGSVDPADLPAIARSAQVAGEPARTLFEAARRPFAAAQAEDGGWTTSYGAAHRPAATVDALAFERCYLR